MAGTVEIIEPGRIVSSPAGGRLGHGVAQAVANCLLKRVARRRDHDARRLDAIDHHRFERGGRRAETKK